jgi:hypothetical protein
MSIYRLLWCLIPGIVVVSWLLVAPQLRNVNNLNIVDIAIWISVTWCWADIKFELAKK